MIIETRYRDIPWEDVLAAHGPGPGDRPDYWEKLRGKPVSVETPGVPGQQITNRCTEMHYQITDGHPFLGTGKRTWVCPHLAEIGD